MNCHNCKAETDKLYHADKDNLLCEDCYYDLCAVQEQEHDDYLAMERIASWDAEMRAELYEEK